MLYLQNKLVNLEKVISIHTTLVYRHIYLHVFCGRLHLTDAVPLVLS